MSEEYVQYTDESDPYMTYMKALAKESVDLDMWKERMLHMLQIRGLEEQVIFEFDPVDMSWDIRISEYGLERLLEDLE